MTFLDAYPQAHGVVVVVEEVQNLQGVLVAQGALGIDGVDQEDPAPY